MGNKTKKISHILDMQPPASEWDRYVLSNKDMPGLALSAWKEVIEKTFPVQTLCLTTRNSEGNISGGFLGYHFNAPNRILYSLPYGFLADDVHAARCLADGIRDYSQRAGLPRTILSAGPTDYDLDCAAWTKTTVILDTRADQDMLWQNLPRKGRNTIRKAIKNKITVAAGLADIESFHKVYATRLSMKGVNTVPLQFIKKIAAEFGDQIQLFTGYKDGDVVGGIVMYYSNAIAAPIFFGSNLDAMKKGINSFLMWETFKDAADRGFSAVDLGEATPGSGVFDFKTKELGGTPSTVYYYDVMRGKDENPAPIVMSTLERSLGLLFRIRGLFPEHINLMLSSQRAKYGKLL